MCLEKLQFVPKAILKNFVFKKKYSNADCHFLVCHAAVCSSVLLADYAVIKVKVVRSDPSFQ